MRRGWQRIALLALVAFLVASIRPAPAIAGGQEPIGELAFATDANAVAELQKATQSMMWTC